MLRKSEREQQGVSSGRPELAVHASVHITLSAHPSSRFPPPVGGAWELFLRWCDGPGTEDVVCAQIVKTLKQICDLGLKK